MMKKNHEEKMKWKRRQMIFTVKSKKSVKLKSNSFFTLKFEKLFTLKSKNP